MLDIRNLTVQAGGRQILRDFSLTIGRGEVHAIMGPNGAGKSTLSHVLAGKPGYEVTGGEVMLEGKNILSLAPEERAAAGIFLAFQYPVEIPGVQMVNFLRTSLNALRKQRGENEVEPLEFLKRLKARQADLGISDEMTRRPLNVACSGGEKKRNEVLQMMMLEPELAILDETDSGLDIDALRVVAEGVNALRSPSRSFLVITHYQRLLDYIVPDHVHVLSGGKIVRSGGPDLARQLETSGYAPLDGMAAR